MSRISIRWHVAPEEDGQLLRDFLRNSKQISRKALADIKFQGGEMIVNGEDVNVRAMVKSGDVVEIIFPPENRSQYIKLSPVPLTIIYEDEHMLVIDKPHGLPTIPPQNKDEPSLAGAILYYYEQHHIPTTFHAVNRLDKDTSGLLLIAKHRYVHDQFVRLQQKRGISRTYQALVHGNVVRKTGTINKPIARKDGSIIERTVSQTGQRAVTHFSVLDQKINGALIQLKLETGRTHQIRVHMSSIGHPLFGDSLYGGSNEQIERQALHASSITFEHPLLKETMHFTAPLPADMHDAYKALT